MIINQKIKKIRKDKKVTQDWLSYELGISQVAYSKIENGITDISFNQVINICSALNISLTDLMNDDILIKSNEKNMCNLEKWKPVLVKICDDEWKHSMLSDFCEIYKKSDSSYLPLNLKILSGIKSNESNFIFDKNNKENLDIKTINIEISSSNFKITDTSIDIVSYLENKIREEAILLIENHINNGNKFIFTVPLLSDVKIETDKNNNFTPKMIATIKFLSNDDIEPVIKKDNLKLKNSYHEQILDRNKILRKWQPILERLDVDKNITNMLANFSEKYYYYNTDTDNKVLKNYHDSLSPNILPVALKILSKINFRGNFLKFDEYDLGTNPSIENFSVNLSINKDLFETNKNYNRDCIDKLEKILNDEIVNFINHLIINQKFVFQINMVDNLNMIYDNNGNISLNITLTYYEDNETIL